MNTSEQATAAIRRLIESVNRSAGQHQRAITAGFAALRAWVGVV